MLLIIGPGKPVALGHDLFLEPTAYNLRKPGKVKLLVYNGSFAESVNPISSTIVDGLVGNGPDGLVKLSTDTWEETNPKDRFWTSHRKKAEKTGQVNVNLTCNFGVELSRPGSHVVGITLYPSRIALEPEEFLEYLATEAYTEMNLADYGIAEPDDLVRERYTKTGKTIIQSGGILSEEATTPLGLVAEIVPLRNPGLVKKGDRLAFEILLEGKPLANQTIAIGRKQKTLKLSDEDRTLLVSNDQGIIELPLMHAGIWWLKFIHLRPAPEEDAMDFESFWGSLTFEVGE